MSGERHYLATAPAVPREEAESRRVLHLAARARKGAHAMLAMRVVSITVAFTSITVYARLISPEHYGIWAMASLALGIATLFRELALIPSIVQARELSAEQQDTYFWTSIAVSLAACLALALTAPLLARVYDAPLLRPVLWACCISLMLAGSGIVHAALLRRGLQYRKVALVEGGGLVCGLITGVTAAWLWRDTWAFVAGHIANAAWVASTAWIFTRWVPRAPRRRPAKIDLSFSFHLTAYNVLTFASNHVGMAAGYRFGAADLGFYNRAQQLYVVAYFSFLQSLADVGLSFLCRVGRDAAAYRDAYITVARRVAVIFIPYAAVLPILADDLILALLGPDWTPATPILKWLAPIALTGAFASLFAQLLTSQGRAHELRRWALADFVLRAAGAVAGSQFGVVGMAIGYSLTTLCISVPLMAWISSRHGPVLMRHQLVAIWPGVLLALVAALGAMLALFAADTLRLGPGWARLFFVGGAAALSWAMFCLAVTPARDALLGKAVADG